MKEPFLYNALLRCVREDDAAAGAFVKARRDLNLWVMELDTGPDGEWCAGMQVILEQMERHRDLLRRLGNGSSDYTLHLAAESDEFRLIRIPLALSKFSADCGLEIELYVAAPDEVDESS